MAGHGNGAGRRALGRWKHSMKAIKLSGGAMVAVMIAALAVVAPTGPSAAASGPALWDCSSARLGLEKDRVEWAPVASTERAPNGGPVLRKPARGLWVPVILVHGWTSRSTHPNADGTNGTEGAFSHLIDLTANRLGMATVPRSLIGQLQDIPGAAVFTFDYHSYSGRWVTDPHIGPALGKVIDCLAAASGQKVILVGHSMGGLAARYAAAMPDRSRSISRIITLGTPNTGSLAAGLAAAGIDTSSALSKPTAILRLLLSACGQVTTNSMEAGGFCATLPTFAAAFYGSAGGALRAGSAQLGALKAVPQGIPVHALAGDVTFMAPIGWFGLSTTPVPVGDVIVTRDSAVFGSQTSKMVTCKYQLSAVRGVGDTVGMWVRLTAKNDVAQQPLASFTGACFHTSLMRSIELTNEVVGLVDDDINPTLTTAQLLDSSIPPGACGTQGDFGWYNKRPIRLVKGTGIERNQDGSFAGSSVIESSVVGRADFNGDGAADVVLRMVCSGSAPESCCAGRSSALTFVGVFETQRGGALKRIAPMIFGGASLPGDQYGPAQRGISDVRLRGNTIVTTEYIIYNEQYTPEQVGGDPYAKVTVTYALKGGRWTNP